MDVVRSNTSQWCNRWTQLFADPQLLMLPDSSPFYIFPFFFLFSDVPCPTHYEIEISSIGEESQEHPPILYEFNFGSLTNASLKEIERELTEVSWFCNFHVMPFV